MGRKKMRTWFAIVFLITVATELADAQTMPAQIDTVSASTSRWGFGGQMGYFRSSGADQGAFCIGGVARYRIGSMLGFEGTLGYQGKQVFNFGTVSGDELFANVQTVPITASFILFLPLKSTSFEPYFMLGAGLYVLAIDYSPDINKVVGDETKTKLGGHVGAGVNLALTQGIIAHADVRYLLLSQIFDAGPVYDFSSKGYNGPSISLGLMFYF